MGRRRRPTYDTSLLPGLFDDIDAGQTVSSDLPVERTQTHVRGLTGDDDNDDLAGPRIINRPGRPKSVAVPETPPPGLIEPLRPPQPVERLMFISFGSGSSGNCAYLGTDKGGLLIDAGVDQARVVNTLLRAGIDMSSVGGIILTHDHGDHVKYAYMMLRRFRHMRLYCTPKALNGLLRRHNISRRIKDYHQPIFKEFTFHVGQFAITPFEVSHDGTDNVGFMIEAGQHRFVVATDMGVITERADYYMRQATHLMIEANYDRTMLLNGTYPEYLKARILASHGHMDNSATAAYLAEIAGKTGLRHIFLCHLSHDNNTPETALRAIGDALRESNLTVGDFSCSIDTVTADIQLMALPRFEATPLIVLRPDRL